MNGTQSSGEQRSRVFERYLAEILAHPMLSRERERLLAERYRNDGDREAAQELVVSNLRFVVKICQQYRGYGVAMPDLVQEGNIGLIRAVEKFDPGRGFRLISYAVWWIRAALNDLVMRSWSLVKVGTTQTERRLFFKLRSARSLADRETGGDRRAGTKLLVERFAVPEHEIETMEARLAGRDPSLEPGPRGGAHEVWTRPPDGHVPSPEDLVDELERVRFVRSGVSAMLPDLGERERYVVENRVMATDPETLQQIAGRFSISRERVRQIEVRAREKLSKVLIADESSARAALG